MNVADIRIVVTRHKNHLRHAFPKKSLQSGDIRHRDPTAHLAAVAVEHQSFHSDQERFELPEIANLPMKVKDMKVG